MFSPSGFESITGGGALKPNTSVQSGVKSQTSQGFDLGAISFGNNGSGGFTTTQIALISVAAIGVAYVMSK